MSKTLSKLTFSGENLSKEESKLDPQLVSGVT
jgi:hypothetical protein